ncbi:MAG: DUF6268 family outer membrane beta-barrel protein [Kiritimatiellae bacterium]|jgi:hypothetical protein|nr:DUF6268 family outer membrane beta-barrel protein [Kiritimatiellia bacterium]
MMLRKFFAFFLLVLIAGSFSQANQLVSIYKKPLAQFYYTAEAPAKFKNPDASAGNDSAEVSLQQFNASMSFPVLIRNDYMVLCAPSIEVNDFKFSKIDSVDVTTYSVELPFIAFYNINDDFSLMVNVAAGIYSDFKTVSFDDDFKMSWFGILQYKMNPNLDLFVGLAYNRVFGEDTIFPVAGLNWRISDEWFLGLVFPRPFISYQATDKLLLYAGMGPAGGEWDVDNPLDLEDDSDYNFFFSGYRVGGGIEFDLTKHVTVYANVGSTFLRDYKIENDDTTLLDTEVDNTFIATIGLAVVR